MNNNSSTTSPILTTFFITVSFTLCAILVFVVCSFFDIDLNNHAKTHETLSELQEFKSLIGDGSGWRKVSIHDPEVQRAAIYAVSMGSEHWSNCGDFKFAEVLQAEAKEVEDVVRYNLQMKVSWGDKIVRRNYRVDRTADGKLSRKWLEYTH